MKILLAIAIWLVGYTAMEHLAIKLWRSEHGTDLPQRYADGLLLAWPLALLLVPVIFVALLIFRAYTAVSDTQD